MAWLQKGRGHVEPAVEAVKKDCDTKIQARSYYELAKMRGSKVFGACFTPGYRGGSPRRVSIATSEQLARIGRERPAPGLDEQRAQVAIGPGRSRHDEVIDSVLGGLRFG